MNKDDAIREAHRNIEESKYFDSRPAIDCNDRRRVFEAGFDRGWAAARSAVEVFLRDGETIEDGFARNRLEIGRLMNMLARAKNETAQET